MSQSTLLESGLSRWRRVALARPIVRDPLAVALLASLVLHAIIMFARFSPPIQTLLNPADSRLEVILLNARTLNAPLAPEVLAQVNERGRARSPLPAETAAQDGTVIVPKRSQIEQLEARQRELMAMARGPQSYVVPETSKDATPTPEGAESEAIQSVLSRMQAEVERNIEDYNKRPKRLTFGINAVGVNYARYVSDWASRIEQIGTEHYPPESRGRHYDSLIITAEIDRNGKVVDVVINKKSKFESLNRAVKKIIYAGQPYERFTPEMARDGDILQIVRTWTFTNDGLETSSLRSSR